MQSFLFIALIAGAHGADIHLRGASEAEPEGTLMNSTIVRLSMNELKIAENANIQAKGTAKAAQAQRDSYAAHVTVKKALKNYDKVSALVPEARAEALKARMYASEARQHADHTIKVEDESRHIPEMAAQQAKLAVEGWIASDAKASAEAAALSPKEAAKSRADKIAAKVAAAAEPYHLALLRNQKFAAETLNKAKTAQQSSQELQTKAKQMALTAQTMQTAGLGVDAQSMMTTAHGLMDQAETLRQWGDKLYKQANSAESSTGIYTAEAQQAATNAAMTAIINKPMTLPAQ